MKTTFTPHRLGWMTWTVFLAAALIMVARCGSGIMAAVRARATASNALELRRFQDRAEAIYWNEQADAYAHQGPITKVFECYEKGIAADPTESVIFRNLGTALFLYRADAARYYCLDEQQVFDRVLKLYDQAVKLDPTNLELAIDVASTYYGIEPQRPQQALQAWRHALHLATTDAEREGAFLHLARTQIKAGLYDAACYSLSQVKNPLHAEMKAKMARNLRDASARLTAN